MSLTSNQRKTVYAVLACLNAVAVTLQEKGALPSGWAHAAALASFVLAMAMREFSATDGGPDASK